MAKKAIVRHRLPKAPLVEVVFELRWKLEGSSGMPLPLHTDPGLLPLLHDFGKRAEKLGFDVRQDMALADQTVGYGIVHRYRRKDSPEFPLLQVGPGIFAANHGPLYEWQEYKSLVSEGLRAALASYPKFAGFPLEPTLLELRYLDVFDRTLLGTADMVEFVNRGTTMRLDAPTYIQDRERFGDDLDARVMLRKAAKGWKESNFSLELATVKRNDPPGDRAVRLETKVVTNKGGIPKLGNHGQFVSAVEKWLDFAHGLTSPFFKRLIATELMAQFEAD